MIPGTSRTETAAPSNPQSGHALSMTQVQFFVSGSIATARP
jgi:hypothetical protein